MYRFSRRLCQAFVSSSCSRGNRHVSTSCRQFLEITFNCPTTGNLTRTLYSSLSNIPYREKGTAVLCENEMAKEEFIIEYLDLLKELKNPNALIIDVRESKEIKETGKIPGSINIRLDDVIKELLLSEESFQKKYDKSKPKIDTKIIFSCLSGKRAAKAQSELIKTKQYSRVYSYKGSWSEWEEKQKQERQAFIIKYEQLLEEQKNPNVVIIDVREPEEIQEVGQIPGSINIRSTDVTKEFEKLTEKEFEEKYGIPKPTKDTKMIFSCHRGNRSERVQKAMQEKGYKQYDNILSELLVGIYNRALYCVLQGI